MSLLKAQIPSCEESCKSATSYRPSTEANTQPGKATDTKPQPQPHRSLMIPQWTQSSCHGWEGACGGTKASGMRGEPVQRRCMLLLPLLLPAVPPLPPWAAQTAPLGGQAGEQVLGCPSATSTLTSGCPACSLLKYLMTSTPLLLFSHYRKYLQHSTSLFQFLFVCFTFLCFMFSQLSGPDWPRT